MQITTSTTLNLNNCDAATLQHLLYQLAYHTSGTCRKKVFQLYAIRSNMHSRAAGAGLATREVAYLSPVVPNLREQASIDFHDHIQVLGNQGGLPKRLNTIKDTVAMSVVDDKKGRVHTNVTMLDSACRQPK